MADALFRKDIRRQKRELTAIRKARKPRNKPPGYLILPVRGARYPGVLSIMKSGSSAPLYGFSPDHSRKVGALPDKRTSRAETRVLRQRPRTGAQPSDAREGFMLISRPSWLLESSAIFISASNRSTNMVISLLFSPLYDSYPHEPTILARFVQKIWHGHSSAFACFFPLSARILYR